MPSKAPVTVSLTPELRAFIARKVRAGRYGSASEVMREALRLLEEREQGSQDRLPVSNQLVERVVGHLPAGVAIIRGSDLTFQFANPEYLSIAHGREVLGRTIFEVWPEAAPGSFADYCHQVLRTGEPYQALDEPYALTELGSGITRERFFSWSMHRVGLPPDDQAGLLITVWETTDRKEEENSLRQRERALEGELETWLRLQEVSTRLIQTGDPGELYELILDTASAIMHSDFASMQIFCPERGEQGALHLLSFRGFSPAAAKLWEWISPDSTTTCGRALQTRQRVILPDVHRCEFIAGSADFDGYVETGIRAMQTTPLISRAGRVMGMLSTHWCDVYEPTESELRLLDVLARQAADLMERTASEAALRASEERLRALLNATSDVVYSMSPDWKEMRQLWGRDFIADTPEPSRDWLERYIHPDDQQRVTEVIEKAIHAKSTFQLEHRVRRVDGTLGWTSSRAVPILNAQGEIVEWFGAASDVTELRQVAEEREQLLESERAARNEAQRVSRVKDEFLATLSHELRTPLNAILGWAQLLARGGFNQETMQKGMDAISRNARTQAELIGDLLDMSRIISGKLQLQVQKVNIVDVVETAIGAVRHAADAKGVRLVKVVEPRGSSLLADPSRLQQVLWNLLTNAVKFTPAGGEVRLAMERGDSAVRITVADTGQGIKQEFLPYLFERFRQADASTTRKHGGLGLGLSIVRSLVELHGGTVEVHSDGEGKGAAFTVTLPAAVVYLPELSDENDIEAQAHVEEEVLDVSLAGIRVLLVDDEPDARDLLKQIFSDRNAEVTLAQSAGQALEAMRSVSFDVVVSDIGMPEEDGYAFIRRVRSLPEERARTVPAVALTAFARAEDQEQALRAGYQRHISKPVEPAKLVAVVADLIGGGRRNRSIVDYERIAAN